MHSFKIAFSPIYAHPLPAGHRFPMLKYELIPEQLLHEGVISKNDIYQPAILDDETVLLTHDSDYLAQMKNLSLPQAMIRRIGFPLSEKLVERELTIASGTVEGLKFAFESGVVFNIAGGTHHAFTNKGEGFCLLNDQAIAANYLIKKKLANKILIIDLDVHQGNGTAEIFSNNKNVFTFSMHGKANYPYLKERSDLDVELETGIGDEQYLTILKEKLSFITEIFKPDFIFYLSGVDVLKTDKLGKLSLCLSGCYQRDQIVFNYCRNKNIPVSVSMGGGYSESIKIIVDAHCNTFKAAREIYF